jgi:hypothetical protein
VIGSTRQVAVWAYGAPADLRKGFDGLSALVAHGLDRDPLSGDCYLFVNATRKNTTFRIPIERVRDRVSLASAIWTPSPGHAPRADRPGRVRSR